MEATRPGSMADWPLDLDAKTNAAHGRCAKGNDLRQSYRTLAQVAGVWELDVHLMMNHSLPGVNAG
jgi:hypothetical protein